MKKRNIIFFVSLFCLFVFSSFPVLAKEATPGGIRENIKDKIELKKEDMVEKKEQVKQKVTEMGRQRIQNIYGRIRNRLERRINRLQTLTAGIEEKRMEFSNNGYETNEVMMMISGTKLNLETATELLSQVDLKIDQVFESEDPKSLLPSLKEDLKEVKENIQTSRQSLAQAVRFLANLKGGESAN
ncbi:hypothetical protein COT75_04000 [Candidatus Beckwithbacteria bacterium CG10_big_fil_rev_8_21_14_0_10_34_10]|uniref:DUF5667 domain-containing protein n=1 Tax=Candidatus Beckwithbacteria bacterium CG10_big_fil_rev_8_21_14_0_10_34_10 TaxID=1974495 RepID=A0A2H0W8L6_9BACT|nr:MAG: hypothetical protein COT75_04000 [Candidatus Beckwithbacteria bacterium CG10_big_fil_rev_8_21_14_0_10_34_10]